MSSVWSYGRLGESLSCLMHQRIEAVIGMHKMGYSTPVGEAPESQQEGLEGLD